MSPVPSHSTHRSPSVRTLSLPRHFSAVVDSIDMSASLVHSPTSFFSQWCSLAGSTFSMSLLSLVSWSGNAVRFRAWAKPERIQRENVLRDRAHLDAPVARAGNPRGHAQRLVEVPGL